MLITPNIILYYFSFIRYLWISKILLVLTGLWSTEKIFEILPEHNKYGFISESFALNWYIFTALTNKKLLLQLSCRLNTNLFLDSVKLVEYLALAVIVVLSKFCVGPSTRLRYICFYHQYAQRNYYQLQNNDIFSIGFIWSWKLWTWIKSYAKAVIFVFIWIRIRS